jgi:hypothetical protein
MRIKTITFSDALAKALPVLLARTFAHRYKKPYQRIMHEMLEKAVKESA